MSRFANRPCLSGRGSALTVAANLCGSLKGRPPALRPGLIALFVLPCIAKPRWVSIATPSDAYQYFLYAGERRIENAQFSSKNPHPSPEFSYRFVTGRSARTVCQLKDRAGVYWYSPDGKHLDGTFPTSSPTEFTVSSLQSGIRGFGATVAFSGSASQHGAMEIIYFTDRVCSDAGNEYGFSRDLADDSILVYWATYANCSNDGASVCRKTNNPSLGQNFSNVQQENGGTQVQHGFRIYGLDPNTPYTYKMSIDHQRFRIEVWNGRKLAECSGSPDSSRVPCSLSRPVQAWFPIEQLHAGYIVAGTQNDDQSGVARNTIFKVSDILVLK